MIIVNEYGKCLHTIDFVLNKRSAQYESQRCKNSGDWWSERYGRHFCLKLAEAGADVAAADMNEEGLASLKDEAASLPGTVRTYTVNVADEDSVIQLFESAWADFGGLNGIINNAGIFRDGLLVKKDRKTGDIKKMSLKNWKTVVDVDLTGPFLCAREFAERHIASDGGEGDRKHQQHRPIWKPRAEQLFCCQSRPRRRHCGLG